MRSIIDRTKAEARYRFRELIADRPDVWRTVHRVRGHGADDHMASPETDLVVEGYARSGNSYAEAALRLLRPDMRIAHHRHVAAQIMLGVRWNIPTLLLVRDPVDAAASAVLRAPEWFPPRIALQSWINFHRACEPIADRVVVSDFATTTGSIATVVRALNQRYAMHLPLPATGHDQRAMAEVARLSRIRSHSSRLNYGDALSADERRARAAALSDLKTHIETEMPDRVATARALYDRIRQHAVAASDLA